jgi:hypothetical protein
MILEEWVVEEAALSLFGELGYAVRSQLKLGHYFKWQF